MQDDGFEPEPMPHSDDDDEPVVSKSKTTKAKRKLTQAQLDQLSKARALHDTYDPTLM